MSEEDHLDLISRPYENVRTESPPFRLGEEASGSGPVTHEEIAEWLDALPQLDTPDEVSIGREDRISGGVLTGILAADEKALYRQPLLDLMQGLVPEKTGEWSRKVPAWLRQPLRPEERGSFPDLPDDPNSCLFRASIDELLDVNLAKRWDKEEVLDRIKDGFIAAEVDGEGEHSILKQFNYLRDIIQARRRFNGFKEGGSDVIKSLLLVLVRPEPSRLLSWSREETGADDSIMVTAGLLSGIVSGRKRIPADLRPPGLDDRLAWLVAERLCREPGVYGPSSPVPPSRPVDPVDTLLEVNLEEEEDAAQVALKICQRAGWEDCISTILIPPGDETMEMFYTRSRRDGRRKVAAFRIRGEAEMEYEVDSEAFKTRLRREGDNLDHDILKDIRSELEKRG